MKLKAHPFADTYPMMSEAELGVVEACSGLRMLVVFFAVSTAVALLRQRALLQRLLIILSGLRRSQLLIGHHVLPGPKPLPHVAHGRRGHARLPGDGPQRRFRL